MPFMRKKIKPLWESDFYKQVSEVMNSFNFGSLEQGYTAKLTVAIYDEDNQACVTFAKEFSQKANTKPFIEKKEKPYCDSNLLTKLSKVIDRFRVKEQDYKAKFTIAIHDNTNQEIATIQMEYPSECKF